MRGRKPNLRAIEGGLSRTPAPPSWLPEEAKAEWRRVCPGLIRRRVIAETDLAVLASYALAVGTIERMQRRIDHEGDITESGKRHPAFQTLFQALTESRRLAAELGLTPASRAKVGSDEGADDDDLTNMVG